jgi:structural maintenance of chromosome 4
LLAYRRLQVLEKTECAQMKQQLAEIQEQLETERGERARVDQRAAKLLAELEGARVAAESAKHRNRVVAALVQQCASGNIPGVFGRLGDLGGIDEEYDCAISSSCGTLDHIVVDTVSVLMLTQHV